MPTILRAGDSPGTPRVIAGQSIVPLIHFELARLQQGESLERTIPDYESVAVVLRGQCDISVNDQCFTGVGQRADIWSGAADSVYATRGAIIRITALKHETEVALAGGHCTEDYPAYRILPGDVEMVEVGSRETHSRRRIFHILGNKHAGRAGNLLVSELYCDDGCWSGYPAHKHDTDRLPEETCHQELYHYRFQPETGFGGQFVFQPDGVSESYLTHHGDTVLIDRGYHPTVTSPGHREYIFTILVGSTQRSLIQNFLDAHCHLLEYIPGIGAMRAAFR